MSYDLILIVCNKFSKISHFITIIEKIIAEGLARLFKNNIWKSYKLPESVISDRGLQFVANLIKKCYIPCSVHIHSDL